MTIKNEATVERFSVAPGRSYHGEPCGTCGGTERYVCNDACVECSRRRARERSARITAEKRAARDAAAQKALKRVGLR